MNTTAKKATAMHAEVDGQRWRLRFMHTQVRKPVPARKPVDGEEPTERFKIVGGQTVCFVEQWTKRGDDDGWVEVAKHTAKMGRSETGFNKEQGRQFAMVRALHDLPKPLVAALIASYLTSGNRPLCEDLKKRGFNTLYAAAWKDLRPQEAHP